MLESASLAALDAATALGRELTRSGGGRRRALRNDQRAYLSYGKNGGEELYGVRRDPGRFANLAKDARCAVVFQEFRVRLAVIK